MLKWGGCGQFIVCPSTLDLLQLHGRSPMGYVLWKQRRMMTGFMGQGQGDPGRKKEATLLSVSQWRFKGALLRIERSKRLVNTVNVGKRSNLTVDGEDRGFTRLWFPPQQRVFPLRAELSGFRGCSAPNAINPYVVNWDISASYHCVLSVTILFKMEHFQSWL